MSSTRPRRLLRNSRACDFCHRRRIKCQSSPLSPNCCQNCADFAVECTYSRPLKRGGVTSSNVPLPATQPRPARHASPPASSTQPSAVTRDPLGPSAAAGPETGDQREQTLSTIDQGWAEPLSPAWQSFARTATPMVKRLVRVYHETVYPIFPFFDLARLEQRLDTLEHSRNRAFFCSVMAACALSSARLRDGALVSSSLASSVAATVSPEMFFAAAEEALPSNILQCRDFDYLRGFALLSLASLQDAKIRQMKMYIGQYFTILTINQWYNESNWPEQLRTSEREEWRRLYWSMYTLDIYSSIIWDGWIHYGESPSRVEYPTGRFDAGSQDLEEEVHWIVGWNFTTDLYRVLEHSLGRLRSRSSRFNLVSDLAGTDSVSLTSQHRVNQLYNSLPAIFKQLQPATGDSGRDIYGFQAANIKATMSLLRMVDLSLEDGVDLDTKCSVVHDVLTTFHQVPKPYLRAISTPLIYHIGGIGVILGSVMEGALSTSSCRRVKDLLLSMAGLLESLEAFLHQSAGAGQRLRDLVVRLEQYMENRRTLQSQNGKEPPTGAVFQDEATNAWVEPQVQDLSPQFQLPDEFLQDWTWPFAVPNTYLSF